MYGVFSASLTVIALMLATSDTFARTGAAPHGVSTSAHSISHPLLARSHRHHNNRGTYWPGVGDGYYEPSTGEPTADVTQPPSGDVHYTYDVPWDWAHRYPPAVTPSERPYVPSCPTETISVAGHDGKRQSVNITQCF
jgi:hypothetical protein